MPYLYPISLAAISLLLVVLERLWPMRTQPQWRTASWSDAIHLIFNGHFLGVMLAGLSTHWLLPPLDQLLARHGLMDLVYRNAAVGWPLWLQMGVCLIVVDFLQWCVHNLLHRVPWLWELHKAHHSVVDGEMDWIVSFRFSWFEVIVYRTLLYVPLVFFGFDWVALSFHAIFGTLIGHLNHANLDLGHGPWRFVLNSPRMHIWHHDYEGDSKSTVNFGIIFSAWDWLFGTAHMPEQPPARLGFHGVEDFPTNFFSQQAWPLARLLPRVAPKLLGATLGAALLSLAWLAKDGRSTPSSTPMLGETAAASQPSVTVAPADAYSASAAEARAALPHFGDAARAAGFAHADAMVSVAELARALGASHLVVIDVRPPARFAAGHVPGARQLYRGDYSIKSPIPGVSRSGESLKAILEARGVSAESTVVLYGDGGPEPYRLWWTLRTGLAYETRVLDGGLASYKAAGHHVAMGPGLQARPGTLGTRSAEASPHWDVIQAFQAQRGGAVLLDTRSAGEYDGSVVHPRADRGGHIPGALHLDWSDVFAQAPEPPHLLPPHALRALFEEFGVGPSTAVVTYCQSGTRSAAVYFALHAMGHPEERLRNYDGSWAEYSRLGLAVAP